MYKVLCSASPPSLVGRDFGSTLYKNFIQNGVFLKIFFSLEINFLLKCILSSLRVQNKPSADDLSFRIRDFHLSLAPPASKG